MKILGNDWAVKERKDCSVDWPEERELCEDYFALKSTMSFSENFFFPLRIYRKTGSADPSLVDLE